MCIGLVDEDSLVDYYRITNKTNPTCVFDVYIQLYSYIKHARYRHTSTVTISVFRRPNHLCPKLTEFFVIHWSFFVVLSSPWHLCEATYSILLYAYLIGQIAYFTHGFDQLDYRVISVITSE